MFQKKLIPLGPILSIFLEHNPLAQSGFFLFLGEIQLSYDRHVFIHNMVYHFLV